MTVITVTVNVIILFNSYQLLKRVINHAREFFTRDNQMSKKVAQSPNLFDFFFFFLIENDVLMTRSLNNEIGFLTQFDDFMA